jgi:Flp pilus assembly protein TadG
MIIWCIGLAILLLPLGGISLDLWHAVSEERQLQTMASSAADAGASGVNTNVYRQTGQVILDPSTATALADANLADQTNPPTLSSPPAITVSPDDTQITVELQENVHLTLMGIVLPNRSIHIDATGSAAPRASGAS